MSDTTRRDLIRNASLASAAALGAACTVNPTTSPSPSTAAALAVDPIPLDPPLELSEVPTPALLVDVEAMERNLLKMKEHAESSGIGLRPHTKTHKCPHLARRQIELGAVGVCCAKVSEAEVMAAAGVEPILITSPVVTPEKISRVLALTETGHTVSIVVDHPTVVQRFDEMASARGVVQPVVIDLDPGTRRTGIAMGEPALELARQVAAAPSLRFEGLQAYAGHLMHIDGFETRAERSNETLQRAIDTRDLIVANGIEVGILTGGGTGTYDIDSEIEAMTDLQVGSYLFMDLEYRAIGDAESEVFDAFEPSLHVLATAISQPVEGLITVDAGYKSMASDSVKPQLADHQGILYHWGGDEHGILQFEDPNARLALADKIRLSVPHCDPTVNLYDHYCAVRGGQVFELWPISARGKSQ